MVCGPQSGQRTMPQGSLGGPIKNADGWSKLRFVLKKTASVLGSHPLGKAPAALWHSSMAEDGFQHLSPFPGKAQGHTVAAGSTICQKVLWTFCTVNDTTCAQSLPPVPGNVSSY